VTIARSWVDKPLSGMADAPDAPSRPIPAAAIIAIKIVRITSSLCYPYPIGLPGTLVPEEPAESAGRLADKFGTNHGASVHTLFIGARRST